MNDLAASRAEPDPAFADRLEHELLRLLTDPAATLVDAPPATELPDRAG